jgi:hypothetical protein
MDDMNLFNRFHAAFEEAPPRGAFERLQSDLIKHSAARRARPAFHLRWSRMSLRLTAAVAVVVIAIALVAAYIAAQRPTVGGLPAGSSGSVAAYQSMVQANYTAWGGTPFNCHTVTDSSCGTDLASHRAVLLKWRGQLDSFRTPNRFTVIDVQMRRHLDSMVQKFGVMATAVNSQNQNLFDNAMFYGAIDVTWLDHAAQGIARSHVATSSQYTALVQAYGPTLAGGCSNCQQDATLGDCVTIGDPLCPHDVTTDSDWLSTMQADFVETAAPAELIDQSMTLQVDLAHADDALMAAGNALIQNDSMALKSARAAYLDAMMMASDDLQS